MKKLILASMILAVMTMPAMARVTTIEFAGFQDATASGWSFDTDTFTFGQSGIGAGNGSILDALVEYDAWVEIPDLVVSGNADDGWTLTPDGEIFIRYLEQNGNSTTIVDLMEGTLNSGDLVPKGTGAEAYTDFRTDILVSQVSNPIGSSALDSIAALPKLDFFLSISWNENFEQMLIDQGTGHNGLSGTMTVIPAPGAILLGSIGVGFVSWMKRRRAL